ncbi:MAG: winged helix-turn-helix domain-containing protein, partial [Deltaproteobacteria bacterium]|nr:winged helix-turn-helix domain-containing protein [Deltaproteobacteria bacterium]
LDVGRLTSATLVEMAQAIETAGTPADVQAAIGASAGSPWLLKQYLAAGAEGLAHSRAGVLSSLSTEACALLRTLSVIDAPLDREVLQTLLSLPAQDELASMMARGLVIGGPAGFTVHGQVAEFLFPPGETSDGSDEVLGKHIAEALGVRPAPEAALEAARLHREAGRVEDLVSLLDERGHDLMALGYAPRVWALVGDATDRRLGLWQLRCAAELGNATVLAAVQPPKLTSDGDQLAWAATQYLLGEREEARRIAQDIAKRTDDPGTAADAALLSARCLLRLGQAADAAAELSEVHPPGDLVFAHGALTCLADACLDREGVGSRSAALLAAATADSEPEALLDLAAAFYRGGDRVRADDVIERVLSTPRGGRASLLVARRAMLLRARIRLDRGELEEMDRLVELVRPYARGASILRPLGLELDATRRMIVGDLDGLDVALARGVELARHADSGVTRRLVNLGDRLQRLSAKARTETDIDLVSGTSPWDAPDEERLRAAVSAAYVQLEEGFMMEAIDGARAARRDAARIGLRLLEVEALFVLADALMAGLYLEDLAEVTEALHALGDALGSPRLLHHAAFYEGHGEVAVLERLADETLVAPTVARRAQALLGGTPELEAVDDLVLAVARADWDERRVEVVCGGGAGEWGSGWGLDAGQSAVWLPDGRVVQLHKKPLLWRVLASLADHAGEATKEQLINEAWGEDEYHPIRHDPKLHVSIRSLRKVLEDDPSTPSRLLTTDDGYRLGGVVRRVVVFGQEA